MAERAELECGGQSWGGAGSQSLMETDVSFARGEARDGRWWRRHRSETAAQCVTKGEGKDGAPA